MTSFADTSFLFAFYLPRAGSDEALAKVESLLDTVLISPLVRFEFQQAVRFKVWLHARGQPLGLSEPSALSALAAFELDIEQGAWDVASPAWEQVITRAEQLAVAHTPRHGARAMDILHLASAMELSAEELLSFDENQRKMAHAEGLTVSP